MLLISRLLPKYKATSLKHVDGFFKPTAHAAQLFVTLGRYTKVGSTAL